MHAVFNALQNVGIFILFLAARFAVLLVVLAALTVVFLAGLAVVRTVQRARRHALGLTMVDGLMWRTGVYFSAGHSWLQPREGGILRVGIDDLAQHVLSRVSEVLLPEPGRIVKAGEAVAIVRAGKRRAMIPSPVSGRIVAINRKVGAAPARLHTDPYASGWLYAVEPEDASYTRLPYGNDSRGWFSGEAIRLSQFLEHQLGMAAADGGELVAPGPSLLTDAQWDEMTGTFLRATR
jgi:glycine cleavage system H protein